MRYCLWVALLTLAACTPQVQPFEPAHEDVTVKIEQRQLTEPDGVVLPLRSWLPASRPKAVIIGVHGFNDYSYAFRGAGEFFKSKGFATYAYDQRGFGSALRTGIWAGEDNLVRDLAECVRQTKRRYPGTPVYLMGESMGGALTLVALAKPDFPKVEGAILVAPAVWGAQTMNIFYSTTLWLATYTVPSMTLTGNGLHIQATDNISILRQMGADPLIIKKTRVDTIHGLVGLMSDAYDKIPQVRTPVLMLYGAHDEVIPSEPVTNALKRFSEPVTYAYYPQGYHMLLRDLEGQVVMEDIVSWIQHPGGVLPSAKSTPIAP